MKVSALIITAVLAAFVHASSLHTQVKATPRLPASDSLQQVVDAAAQPYLASPHRAGLSVGVYINGKSYFYNYGTTDATNGAKPTENTLYAIASITKTFTSNLLAQAATEGKLGLHDDIRNYIGGSYPNLEFNHQPIRLYQLTNHRSGLPYMIPDMQRIFTDTTLSEDQVARINYTAYPRKVVYSQLHNITLDTVPGYRFMYSGVAMWLAGYILEDAYHQSYERILKEKIFKPLGMAHTFLHLPVSYGGLFAKGHDHNGTEIYSTVEGLGAAGGLCSTTADLLKYAAWQLDEANLAAKLSHMNTLAGENPYYWAGLNWQVIQSKGNRVIWQEGNIPGYTAFCVSYPEARAAIVVLSNQADKGTSGLLTAMINTIAKQLGDKTAPLP